jgi:CRP-like cAMP-binding protein
MKSQTSLRLQEFERTAEIQSTGRLHHFRASLQVATHCSPGDGTTTEGLDSLRQCSLFSSIPMKEREEIVRAAHKCEFSRGQTIHIEGDPARELVLLVSGWVKLAQLGYGTEMILGFCGPGEFVGTAGLASQGLHCATAQALRPSEALVWEMAAFDLLAKQFPALRRNTALILSRQLIDMEDRFREISTESVSSRLSHQIVRLMNQAGCQRNGAVEIRISREELAQLIGSAMGTVSRLLSEWDKKGIVRARREAVAVQNLQALEHLCDAVC